MAEMSVTAMNWVLFNMDSISDGALFFGPDGAKKMATEIFHNMSNIHDSHARYFCALSIGDACTRQPSLKAELDVSKPVLMREVEAAERESFRRMAFKEVRKGVEYASFLRDQIEHAKNMSQEEAISEAGTDVAEAQSMLDDESGFVLYSKQLDMALKCKINPIYADAVLQSGSPVATLIANTTAPKFLDMNWEVPMQSLAGCKMVFCSNAGMAGAEIVMADDSRIGFGGREAIEAYAHEKSLSPMDLQCLFLLDSLVDIHGLRLAGPEMQADLKHPVSMDQENTVPLEVPESCATFLSLLSQGKNAALDVNTKTGEGVCMRSFNADMKTQGNGVVPVPYTNEWRRIASSESGVLSLDESGLADASKVSPLLASVLIDYDGIKGLVPDLTRNSAFTLARQDDGVQHCGEMSALSFFFAVQSAGRGNYVLHKLAALDQTPVPGHLMEIKYRHGVGAVTDKTVEQGRAGTER